MRAQGTQRHQNSFGKIGILAVFALPACFYETPYPECWVYSPECVYESADEGGSGDGTSSLPTSEPFPAGSTETGGDDNGASSGDVGANSGESSAGTTGPEMQAQPVIVGMSLTPGPGTPGSCVLYSAGPVAVTVQVEGAEEVWIAVDDGEAVALEPVGDDGTEFVGEIAVLGESWNGSHTVWAIAESGELTSAPWGDMFTVVAPEAGSEAWKKKSAITPSKGNAVAVDAQGEVYELFTEWSQQGARCHVRRRDPQGEPVWLQDAVALAPGVSCGGEDIKVAPDGTIWALTNTVVDGVNRWQLFHLDPDGAELGEPEVSDFQEFGRGLDVNTEGDLLLCGERPAIDGQDAWVKLSPPVGDGWTVPWAYEVGNEDFDERTRDCAFVEDRIVVVGEVFGIQSQNEVEPSSRGFVAEYSASGSLVGQDVATAVVWQGGHEAVTPDGHGGYVTVGYTCDAKVVPCTPMKGVIKWFSPGPTLTKEQPVKGALRLWDVATSPAGHVVMAVEALEKQKGFLVQAWVSGDTAPLWQYQGTPGTLQVATGLALNPYGSVYAGGYFLDGDVLAAGLVKLHPY